MMNNITFHTAPAVSKRLYNSTPIYYNTIKTQFGNCLIGLQNNKICHISFQDDNVLHLENLKADWPGSNLSEDPQKIETVSKRIFEDTDENIDVLLKGTDFQVNVWKELTKIKKGTTVSYEEMANLIGKPNAVRAVANAIAKNRIAYLIPCHRVVRKSGNKVNYRWGADRKRKILDFESSR